MKQKILIIEDEPDVVELVRYNLLEAGYVVEAALTGAEGLRMAPRQVDQPHCQPPIPW